ncbi:hypothetical protein FRC16_001206, partial [Serendipita sp. 398]
RGRKPGSKLSEHSKMLRRLEREMKTKGKEGGGGGGGGNGGGGGTKQSQAQKTGSSSTATTSATPAAAAGPVASSSSGAPTALAHHPPQQPPPIQTSYPTQAQSQQQQQSIHVLPPSQQPPPHEILTSDHSHPASLTSGSSGVGSTPTQLFDMPYQVTYPSSDTRQSERDSVEESTPDADENIYPARVVDKETKRHSFFGTILNPTNANENVMNGMVGERGANHKADAGNYTNRDGRAIIAPPVRALVWDPNVQDPIAAGLLDEKEAKVLFDLVFMRLNGFINLFDPRLHTVPYVRSRSPFLFSVLIMAGCKFWKAELYRQCQQIAHSFALKAFAEGWQSLETCQAFESLTYWKEPDDTRTWTYVGYACRMAVELGLNTYVGHPEGESEEKKRERRNRERTYLVLWVHDRSLSMQTGRNWMLPEDDIVRHSKTWHEGSMMPEDVIVAAMVNLRQIAAETTDVYRMQRGGNVDGHYSDVNHEILLRGCNSKLTQWMDYWDAELKRASGLPFHYSFLGFFRLHVRLFLNSLGLQSTSTPLGRTSPSLQSLSICYTSAIQSLEIITRQFAPWGLLRYGQDSITVMSAYSAVFLIKLLRRTSMLSELAATGAHRDIHDLISQTADVYQEAALLAVSSSSAAYHARFLRALVARDAESKIPRPQRRSLPSSRASPDAMDEDGPRSAAVSTYSPVHPTAPHPIHHQPSQSTTTPPQYASFPSAPHPAAVPAVMHATPQMSPTETKPLIYRGPPHPPTPTAPGPPPPNGAPYAHYGSTVEYHPHPSAHAPHPPMVVSYPAAVMQPPPHPSQQSQHPQVGHSTGGQDQGYRAYIPEAVNSKE